MKGCQQWIIIVLFMLFIVVFAGCIQTADAYETSRDNGWITSPSGKIRHFLEK